MAEKISLRVAEPEEESVDLSLSFTPACSVYMAVLKGIDVIASDIEEMGAYILQLQTSNAIDAMSRNMLIKKAEDERDIAKLALDNSRQFLMELKGVINELDKRKDTKILIHKPTWAKE